MTRTLLTFAVLAVFVLCLLAMWWGHRNRARRQAAVLPPFPAPPENVGADLLAPLTGVYVGTTTAGDWQDRIAVGDVGYRAAATLRLTSAGVLVDRDGASPLWIPAEAVREARTAQGLAGKVMLAAGGLLVIRWRLGGHTLDTGFRGDDKDVYREWQTAIGELVATRGKAPQ